MPSLTTWWRKGNNRAERCDELICVDKDETREAERT